MMIRTGKAEDAIGLVDLLEQLGHPLSEGEVQAKIRFFTKPEYRLLVCEVEGLVLGFISLHWFDKFHSVGKTGRITALCVHESERDIGIGGALVSAAEALLKENGCREIEVTSN